MPMGHRTRRDFMRRAATIGSVGAGGLLGLRLATMASVSAQAASSEDFKALVCYNMLGGNDHLDTLYPYDPDNYNALRAIRGNQARDRATLLPITTATSQNGKAAALHPSLVKLRERYNKGQVAIIPNVGAMRRPYTRAQLIAGAPLPPGAGSHNDGNAMWHALDPDGAIYGWGGLMADAVMTMNPNPTYSSINAGIYNPFGSGKFVQQYAVSSDSTANTLEGVGKYGDNFFGSPTFAADAESWLSPNTDNLMEKHYVGQVKRVLDGAKTMTDVFEAQKNFPRFYTNQSDQTAYRNNRAGFEMRAIAQVIASRKALGVRRQILFVDHFGFDTHGSTVIAHGDLMKQVDAALGYFADMLDLMGLSENVTTFTTSDFGRSLIPGGDGTGHGWSGCQFVMGGAVKGGDIYGELPTIGINSNNFLPDGSMIPHYSVEQMIGPLGRWFGVSEADLAKILPNRGQFPHPDPAFMR